MSLQWKYGNQCKNCKGEFGKRRCKGLCGRCYDHKYKDSHPYRRVVSERQNWKTEEFAGFKPSPIDWARLAAFIDGEGSINFTPRQSSGKNRKKSLTLLGRVTVTNTDARLTLWCYETFGIKFYVKSHKWANEKARERNWKDCYFSQASGYQAAWILHNCLSWFILKREQAEVVLAHQETTKTDAWERGPGITTPQELLDYRLSLKEKLHDLNRRGPVTVH